MPPKSARTSPRIGVEHWASLRVDQTAFKDQSPCVVRAPRAAAQVRNPKKSAGEILAFCWRLGG
jgi:hypothetical protein